MITKQGVITAAKMQGTVTVTTQRHVYHPIYKKKFRVSKKFLADTNGQDLGVGDEVIITECRPLSKRKRFTVTEVLKRAPRVSEMAEEGAVTKILNREKNKPASSASSESSESST